MKIVLVALGVCLASALNLGAQCQFSTTAPDVTETCGKVGIGTAAPAQKLTVSGGHIAVDNGWQLIGRNGANSFYFRLIGNDASDRILLGDNTGSVANEIRFHANASATPTVLFSTNGNVGIGTGTTIPPQRLTVSGGHIAVGNGWQLIGRNGADSFYFRLIGNDASDRILLGDNTGSVANEIRFHTNASATPTMVISTSGNVGIGTGTVLPVTKLQVAGDIATSGSVGVNGAAPRVWASGTAVQGPTSAAFFGNVGDIHMISNAYTTGTSPGWKYMAAGVASNMYLYNGEVVFRTATSGLTDQVLNWTTAMRIKNSGKVGIGIDPTPTDAMLHVAGDVIVDGNLAAKYQDVAEWVPAAEEMAAGTVVVVSGTTKNTVGPSQHAYDTRVAGVVSSQPGLTLGEGSSTKTKIATTGRVRVRVDATNHAIAMGDLLVTRDTSGAAMFSEPLDLGGVKIHRPGTLIGKALESLAGGEGEILVLLSLQ